MDETRIRNALIYAKTKEIMVAPDALVEFKSNYKEVIDLACKNNTCVISKEFVLEHSKEEQPRPQVEIRKKKILYAKEIDSDIKILHETNVTDRTKMRGKVSEFLNYFNERFKSLKSIIEKHPNMSPTSSKELNVRYSKGDDVVMIGMVQSIQKTKKDNLMVLLEDEEGEFRAVITQKDEDLFDAAKGICNDDVIGIRGVKLGDSIIVANETEYPDMPNRSTKKAVRDVYAVSISDVHIGSNLFYGDKFQKFIDWISLKNNEDFDTVSKIKYLFVAGDVVDGIGIYPQQINELTIYDIYEQFNKTYEFLSQIPEHIEVIIGPGNHDPVRLADPQPAIDKEFAKELYDLENVHFVGSPTWVEIEGLKTLMYHGNSMFSVQNALGLSATKPEDTMQEMLKRRDIAPIYGTRHPILPEAGGYLVMREEPDIFITGHIHSNGYGTYKGCTMINPGTWQGQTSYQKEQGHEPTPGRVPILKLQTAKIEEKVFIDESS